MCGARRQLTRSTQYKAKKKKKKNSCVYCNMSGKKWVRRSGFLLAVIMLYQHKFCVYKGKRKLKLLITFENFVLFVLLQFLLCFVKIFLEKVEKKFTVEGF